MEPIKKIKRAQTEPNQFNLIKLNSIMANASRCLVVNNYNTHLYLNFPIWAGSIMANASSCRLEHRGSILRLSTAT